MSSISRRLGKLEQRQAPGKTARLIVLENGIYEERGQAMTEAEYQAIASDPANDVTIIEIVRTKPKQENNQ
jgi:hypothetical protein